MKDTVQIQPGHCSEIDPRRLFSVAREVIAAPTQPLIHQGARFLYVSKGEGTLLLQGRGYRLREGTLVAIMPWQISEVTEVSAPLTYYLIRYQLDAVNLALKSLCSIAQDDEELLSRIEAAPVVICGGRGAERIDSIVGLLQAEPEDSDGGHSSAYAISLIIELMILFCRQGQGKEGRASAAAGGRSEAALLRYIYTHLNEKLTITELSAMFYMSEGSIRKYIREVSGLSFFDLLAEMRVTRTMNFLLYTDFTLEEIAGILGYVDASHMSKVFAARMDQGGGIPQNLPADIRAVRHTGDPQGLRYSVQHIPQLCRKTDGGIRSEGVWHQPRRIAAHAALPCGKEFRQLSELCASAAGLPPAHHHRRHHHLYRHRGGLQHRKVLHEKLPALHGDDAKQLPEGGAGRDGQINERKKKNGAWIHKPYA